MLCSSHHTFDYKPYNVVRVMLCSIHRTFDDINIFDVTANTQTLKVFDDIIIFNVTAADTQALKTKTRDIFLIFIIFI